MPYNLERIEFFLKAKTGFSNKNQDNIAQAYVNNKTAINK